MYSAHLATARRYLYRIMKARYYLTPGASPTTPFICVRFCPVLNVVLCDERATPGVLLLFAAWRSRGIL
jgi:hypothetical protein